MKTSNVLKVVPVTLIALLTACTGENKNTETTDEKIKVKVEAARLQSVEQLSEFTATVQAHVSNKIAPQSPVRIQQLHVEVGDRVNTGQLLATMDNTSLEQLRIQIQNQETEFKRIDELYKVGGASKSSWDQMKAALDVNKASLKNLETNIHLVSPIAGVVTARNYDSGDMYAGAMPVYVVEQLRPVKLMVNVSESFYTSVKKGMDVAVRLDVYGSEVFNGKVHLIYPTIDAATRTFQVEIRIPNGDERIRPGMFARATMSFGTREHIVVPDESVVEQAGSGDRYVYVYRNGAVSYQKVELGRRMGNKYELISGLEDGDQVVITDQSRLVDGTAVEVVQ